MSHDGNGNGSPLAFAPKSALPIIGQPQLEGWLVQLFLRCNCEAHALVVIVGQPGAMGQCATCQKVWILQHFRTDAQGEPQFQLGLGVARNAQKDPS